jgi:hypothetical protein
VKVKEHPNSGRTWWEWMAEAREFGADEALLRFKEAYRESYFGEYRPPCEALASRDPIAEVKP